MSALPTSASFTLSSPSFSDGDTLPDAHVHNAMGCTGQNRSPALQWQGAPEGTKSFAVTVYDPDAPTGSGWWHWVVYDLPASTTSLPEAVGTADGAGWPQGAKQARTDFGVPGYGGAAPPPGDKPHRYIFTVYALKSDTLDVPADASPAMIGFHIHFAKLAQAKLTALYGR